MTALIKRWSKLQQKSDGERDQTKRTKMLRLGQVFERRCVGIIRKFASGPVPPNSKYIKPKPGAGQKENLEEKNERLRQAISKLKEESAKRTEAGEDQVAQLLETKLTKKEVSKVI